MVEMLRNDAIYYDIPPIYVEHRLLMPFPVEAKMYDYIRNVVPITQCKHSLQRAGATVYWL